MEIPCPYCDHLSSNLDDFKAHIKSHFVLYTCKCDKVFKGNEPPKHDCEYRRLRKIQKPCFQCGWLLKYPSCYFHMCFDEFLTFYLPGYQVEYV